MERYPKPGDPNNTYQAKFVTEESSAMMHDGRITIHVDVDI
jgi:hypothetical protein